MQSCKVESEPCGGKLMLCLSVCIQAVQHASRGSKQAEGQYMMVLPGVAAAREGCTRMRDASKPPSRIPRPSKLSIRDCSALLSCRICTAAGIHEHSCDWLQQQWNRRCIRTLCS